MLIFCFIVHHLWGRTLNKHNQDACAVAYADDGYIKAKLSITLEVLSRLGHQAFTQGGRWPRSQFRQDQDSRQGYSISAADAHAAAQRMLNADPSLAHLRPLLSPASFVVDGYIGLGVPIGLILLSSTLSVK